MDVFNARDAINNEEQDPEAIQDRNQQEAMRDYLGANIVPINVAPLQVYKGTICRQHQVSEFFPAKNNVLNKESIIFYSVLRPKEI